MSTSALEQSRRHHLGLLSVLATTFLMPSVSVGGYVGDDFQWATITALNNPAYAGGPQGQLAGRGSVGYAYRISKLEITSAQWLEFINTFAPQSDDPLFFLRPSFSGIIDVPNGPAGVYQLDPSVKQAGQLPVMGITWREAAMYCNWLHNGKSKDWSAIQNGAYDVSTFGQKYPFFFDQPTHSPDAKFWIPTLDEWMKAAHYDPNMSGQGKGGWWDYPNGTNTPLIPGPPGSGQTSAGPFESTLDPKSIPLGSYLDVTSPWGLWDVSGGASEWTEEIVGEFGQEARIHMGSWAGANEFGLEFDKVWSSLFTPPYVEGAYEGLRIVSPIPAPSALPLLGTILFTTFARSRKRP